MTETSPTPPAQATIPAQRDTEDAPGVSTGMLAYYSQAYDEETRLARTLKGRIEMARMKLIINRHVLRNVPRNATIADIGGGPGVYSRWLTGLGYAPALIDPVDRHVERARAFGINAVKGDARDLPWEAGSINGALMMGPLYHLKELPDRLRALRAMRTVLKPGAPAVVTVLNRFTPLIGTTIGNTLLDHHKAVREITGTGQWTNGDGGWMSEAYYHTMAGLRMELKGSGFDLDDVVGVSGPGTWLGVLADRYLADGQPPQGVETALMAAEIADEHPETLVLSSMWAALVWAV